MLRFLLWVAAEEFGLRPVQFCLQRPGVSDTLSIPLLGEPRYFEDPLCVYVRKNGVKATGRIKVRRFHVRFHDESFLFESGKWKAVSNSNDPFESKRPIINFTNPLQTL
jgi:hypothetical protein